MTSLADYRIVTFDKGYDRKNFDCGNAALNRYLAEQASQDVKRRINSCYLAIDADGRIAGFYTLCSSAVPYDELGDTLKKKLPRYARLPAALIGRLAVDVRHQGRRLGAVLLADAVRCAAQSPIAACVLIVRAKDRTAVRFYRHFGFISFQSIDDKLYYPLTGI